MWFVLVGGEKGVTTTRKEFIVKLGIRLFGVEVVGITADKSTAQAKASDVAFKVKSALHTAANTVAEKTATSGEQVALEVHLPE